MKEEDSGYHNNNGRVQPPLSCAKSHSAGTATTSHGRLTATVPTDRLPHGRGTPI
jgi:hypothetical protein